MMIPSNFNFERARSFLSVLGAPERDYALLKGLLVAAGAGVGVCV